MTQTCSLKGMILLLIRKESIDIDYDIDIDFFPAIDIDINTIIRQWLGKRLGAKRPRGHPKGGLDPSRSRDHQAMDATLLYPQGEGQRAAEGCEFTLWRVALLLIFSLMKPLDQTYRQISPNISTGHHRQKI